MSEKSDLKLFLEHWEDMTGSTVSATLGPIAPGEVVAPFLDQTEPFYLKEFFGASLTKGSLPFSCKSLRKPDYNGHLSTIRETLPANPGDLLWLLDRFLSECFPDGGDIDLASGSEHRDSVYLVMSQFVSKATYKHHPHFYTLKAFIHIVEMGATERLIATNALSLAFEILREPFSRKRKTLILKVDGKRKDSTHFVVELGTNVPKNCIAEWEVPGLGCDVELLEDYTDDEDIDAPARSKRERYEEYEEDNGGATKILKMKYDTKGKGRQDVIQEEDDSYMFD